MAKRWDDLRLLAIARPSSQIRTWDAGPKATRAGSRGSAAPAQESAWVATVWLQITGAGSTPEVCIDSALAEAGVEWVCGRVVAAE